MKLKPIYWIAVPSVIAVVLSGCRGGTASPSQMTPAPPVSPTAPVVPTNSPVDSTDSGSETSVFADVIAYTQITDTGPEIHAAYVSPDNPDIWGITETPGAAVLPRWSPSLEYIAYLYYEPEAPDVDFWLVDIAQDGTTRPITHGGVKGVEDFSWSPDSQYLAYHAPQPDGDEPDIYRLDVGSGEIVNLTPDSPAWDSDPAWSPDGTSLAFVSDRAVEGGPALHNIWVMAPDGTDFRSLTTSEWEDVLPSWSPDGTEIAFYRWSLGDREEGGPAGLWAVRADGSGERLVTELSGLVAAGYDPPSWSPDGRFLAFQYGPPDDADVIVVAAEGGDAVRVGEALGHDFALSWSPDSLFVLFCHTLQQDRMLYLAARDGSVADPLLRVGGNCYGEWAPVGPSPGTS